MSLFRRPPLHTALLNIFPLILVSGAASFTTTAQAQQQALPLVQVRSDVARDAELERKNAQLQKIVITEDEVEKYGDATVGDILRRLPGMTFTGPAGVSKDVRMRGLDKGYTQFLINGEAVPGANQERQMQVDRLPADMIERIEIIRNPSAEYDANGIGGTINIVLKSRIDDLTRLRAAYGQNGQLKVGDVIAQWSRRIDNLDILLAASHTVGAEDVSENKQTLNAANAVLSREFKTKPVKKTENLFSPRLSWSWADDRFTLTPFISAGTEDKDEQSEVRNASAALTKSSSNQEYKTDDIRRIAARYDAKSTWGSWYAKLGMQQANSDKDKATSESNAAGVLGKRSKEIEQLHEAQDHVGAGFSFPLDQHTLKLGAEIRKIDYEKRKAVAEATGATGAFKDKAPGSNDIYHIKERLQFVFLQDEWRINDAHSLTPGVRFERTERDASDRNGKTQSGTQSASNPSLHYRWSLQADTNLRASLARTLKLPKFDDVNPLVNLASGAGAGGLNNPDKGGNALLKPERANGVELGLEHFILDSRGVVGFNLYHRDVEDFVQKVTRLEGTRYVERPNNVGNARFWGLELDWRLPALQAAGHSFTFTGSHAEMRGVVSNIKTAGSSSVKDMAPRVTNIGIDWRHPASQWAAGIAFNYTPQFSSDSLNPEGIRERKQRNQATLLDLYISKAFSPMAELRLVAKNVLSVEKNEANTKYNASGIFATAENKTEQSKPTIFLTFESRF